MSRLSIRWAVLVWMGICVAGASTAQATEVRRAVAPEVKHDISSPLREMMASSQSVRHEEKAAKEPDEEQESEIRPGRRHENPRVMIDPIVQASASTFLLTSPGVNFDGVPGAGYKVPDTEGAVGATQYVQWVNTRYAVYDKTTGKRLLGPASGSKFWSGFGGPCQNANDGDIITLYDKAAGRWVVTHHVAQTGGPYLECVAVSLTSDATGSYYRYAFANPLNNYFTDYPKLGVWPDGYYFSTDLADHFKFMGTMVCAFDRNNMLLGNVATEQCFQVADTTIYSFLPADVDGHIAPPQGSPNYFVNLDPTNDALDLWQFHVDWTTPSNSTFIGPSIIPVAHYNEACQGGVCIPQRGSTQLLDSLGDRVMYRLSYRNFATGYESLLVVHSVDTRTTVGVRWYEIRNPGGNPPTLYQQGTYAPDHSFRWMPSIAQDKVGNIAVGYSVSSRSVYPAIRYTGRIPSDPLGTMERGNSIKEGTGAQLPGNGHWGDYTAMTIDPADDCTFWYTNEYYSVNSIKNWRTRIASFKFPSCQ